MKKATLIYEPALAGYSLKFNYDADVLLFFKKAIPSHLRKGERKVVGTYFDRRSGTEKQKTEWTWYFGEEFFDVVRLLFEGHRLYKLKIVSREDVERMQQQQQEASHYVSSTQQISIEDELKRFYALIPHNGTSYEQIKELSRSDAAKYYRQGAMVYHPDRNHGSIAASEKMAELNTVWNILKEAYYIK